MTSPAVPDNLHSSNATQIRSYVEGLLEQRRDANSLFAPASLEPGDVVFEDFSVYVNKLAAEVDIFPDLLSLEIEDLDTCINQVEIESAAVAELNVNLEDEVGYLSRAAAEKSLQMESDLRSLCLDFEEIGTLLRPNSDGSDKQDSFRAESINASFEIFELKHSLDSKEHLLSTLEQLHYLHESDSDLEFVEGIFSDIKKIDHEGAWIKLLVKTFISESVDRLCQPIFEFVSVPLTADHEILIEVDEETFELNNVKIFPDDVYIGEVIAAAKSMRLSFLPLSLLTVKSPLGWLVNKIQYRIFQCSLRLSIVQEANMSRFSFEYHDREDVILAHLVEGVDARIKLFGNWPATNSALKLVSLVSSELRPNGFSISTLCRVQELANSLSEEIRQNLVRFVEAIREMLVRQNFS